MAPFSCIWWHKTQLEVLSGAKEKVQLWKSQTVNDEASCPASSVFKDGHF